MNPNNNPNNHHNKYFVQYNSPMHGTKVFPVKCVNQYYDINYIPTFGLNHYINNNVHNGIHIVKHKKKPYIYVHQPQYYQVPPHNNVHYNYQPSQQPVQYVQQQQQPIQYVQQKQEIKQPLQQQIQVNSTTNYQNEPLNNNINNNNPRISDEQYLKQVEHLKKKLGFDEEKPQFNENELFNKETIDIESIKMNEAFMIMQRAELEEYNRNFDDPIIAELFDITKNIVNKSKEYNRIGWPIWEIPLFTSKGKYFIVQSSLGTNSKIEKEIIEDDWILVDEPFSQSVTKQKNVFFDHKDKGEYMDLELNLLSEEPDIQSVANSVKKYGVRNDLRAFVWQLLLGYLEPSLFKRAESLKTKRRQYYKLLEERFNRSMPKKDLNNLNYILLDTPRTTSDLFPNIIKLTCVKQSLERVLFIWSSVYNSIGYFQGLNEIASIFFYVFLENALSEFYDINNTFNDDNCDNIKYIEEALITIEPDVYFCLELVIKFIGNHYPLKTGLLFTQPMTEEAELIVKQENPMLWKHITDKGISFNIFLFRWILCLFSREFSTSNTICLIDSYIAEGEKGLAKQHVYTIAAFLLSHSNNLLKIHDDEQLMGYLLRMPTSNYSNKDIVKLVKEANQLKNRYGNRI